MKPTLIEIQKFETGILNDIVEFCDKNEIHYYIVFGTLLGAVRHGGFIPWDNDIDIAMPIKDFRKFIRLAKKGLPVRYFVQTYKTDKEYNSMFLKVRVNNTTSLPLRWLKLNMHWGMGIDIFPIVGVYKNQKTEKAQIKIYGFQKALINKDFAIANNDYSWRKSLLLTVMYSLPRSFRHFICDICSLFVMRSIEETDEIAILGNKFTKFNSLEFLPQTNIMFEGNRYTSPENYNYVLSKTYGDYMILPPESERNGHEGILGKIIYDLEKDYKFYQNMKDDYEN